jgi:hypothetical protein
VPDFVLADDQNGLSIAAEFKPPGQTKREYLTGLGQALAYTKDFDYALLVVPDIADDGHLIADYITDVLEQEDYVGLPVGLLKYDARLITAETAGATIARFFQQREHAPEHKARLDVSFYAKWREISSEEVACFLRHLYREQTDPSETTGSIRDRAWVLVWADVQAGRLHNWTGRVRRFADTPASREANMKNWRNFLSHIRWMETDGTLTADGLRAHHVALIYGPRSKMFVNALARAVLLAGKHLILLNTINAYQDERIEDRGPFDDEQQWLDEIETHLEEKGLLKRNPERHAAAHRHQERGFLKAEKQLWKELGFVVPRGRFVYHEGRGFVFDWTNITELLRA